MEEAIYTEELKGYTINIYPDYDYTDNPNDWGNTILVHYHRDFWITADEVVTEDDIQEWYQGKKIDAMKDYWIFGVEAYIHSGVHLSLSYEGNYPDRRWDVSHVGAILVPKKEYRLSKKARECAQSELDTWNAINEGSVYGFVVEKDEEHVDSCWGFVETKYPIEETYVLEEARNAVEYAYEEATKQHVAKRKAQIKNNVPLLAR